MKTSFDVFDCVYQVLANLSLHTVGEDNSWCIRHPPASFLGPLRRHLAMNDPSLRSLALEREYA